MSRVEELLGCLCPNGVEFRPLAQLVVENRGGGTPSRLRSDYWGGEIPWASVGDLSIRDNVLAETRDSITELGLTSSPTNLVTAGDVIVAVKITPGRMKVAGRDMAINQDLRGLRLSAMVDAAYLTYYFETVKIVGNGTIVKGITTSDLERIPIPVPPLEVQREIVRVLDLFKTLDAQLEAELEARRLQYAHYQQRLLSFDADTQWTTLGEIGRVSMCRRVFKNETGPEGEIPFFKIGTFGGTPDAFIPKELYREYRARYPFPKAGDILISAAGTIGRAVVYDGMPAYFQDSNIVWIDNDESIVTNAYLRYWYRVVQWATDGGTIQRLYNDNIRRARIAVPPLGEQARIVAILDKFDALVNDPSGGLPAELAARRKQYEYYRNRLLTFEEAVG